MINKLPDTDIYVCVWECDQVALQIPQLHDMIQ